MSNDGVTVAKAMQTAALDDPQYWWDYRAALIAQLVAVERHRLCLPLTTKDRLDWLKKRGPGDAIIARQIKHIHEMEES